MHCLPKRKNAMRKKITNHLSKRKLENIIDNCMEIIKGFVSSDKIHVGSPNLVQYVANFEWVY